jgi:putative endonuclease
MPSSLGDLGESYAAAYLDQLGYRLVAANFMLPVGRNLRGAIINAEIDLIAYDADTLCFIEVKTRASDWFAPPQVNVDKRKRRQITRAARVYRQMLGIENEPHRFDVVTVVIAGDSTPQIELLRNFWTEESLVHKRHKEEHKKHKSLFSRPHSAY